MDRNLNSQKEQKAGWLRVGLLALVLLWPLPASAFSQEKPFIEEVLQKDNLDRWKKDRKVEHSDAVVSMLLLMGEEALQKGNPSAAIAYGEKAAQFSPESPLPHFFLSHVMQGANPKTIIQRTGEYSTALRLSLNDFWMVSTAMGTTGMALFIAIVLGTLTFLVYAYILYLPQWVHYLQEHLPAGGRMHPSMLGGFLLLVLLVIFHFLPPFWFLLLNLFLFWFFYGKEEKRMAILFLVGLTFLSLLLGPTFLLLTGKRLPLLKQMVINQQAEFMGVGPSKFIFQSELDAPDWRPLFMEASHRVQEKDWDKAETLYRQALLQNPRSAQILNNLGNVFFYQNQLGKAFEYYQKAIRVSPENVMVQYNISQVYKELLLFQKGEEQYRKIKEMAPKQVNAYSQVATTYPDYPVMEERFTKKDLWQEMRQALFHSDPNQDKIEHLWIGVISSRMQFAVIAFFVSLGMISLCIYLSPFLSGGVCSICFKATCGRCQKTFSTYNMCADCGKDLKTAVGKKRGTLPKRVYPFFILPGGGQMALRQPGMAFVFMVFFYFLASLAVFGDLFFSSAYGHLSIEKSPLLFVFIFLLYLLSLSDLLRRRKDFAWH